MCFRATICFSRGQERRTVGDVHSHTRTDDFRIFKVHISVTQCDTRTALGCQISRETQKKCSRQTRHSKKYSSIWKICTMWLLHRPNFSLRRFLPWLSGICIQTYDSALFNYLAVTPTNNLITRACDTAGMNALRSKLNPVHFKSTMFLHM